VLFKDVSDRREAEAQLVAAAFELESRAAELERSNAELEQFAYVASHDLSEPLRMISGFTQLLAQRYRGRLDGDADEFIAYVVDGVERMQALINDLLEYSRVGRRTWRREPVDVGAVVEDTLRALRPAIEEAGASVDVGPLPTLPADAVQLGQVFLNLIGNAIKFRGEEPPRVRVSAQQVRGGWRFEVADNGIGIEPRHGERIFKMFQRLHARDSYAGTGIGLAISKKIVERHGGRIWVEAGEGGGSRFLFTVAEAEEAAA
jgi:light-regulated signal transduction histidine kinase (bacteriophytochrome)